MPFDWMDAKLPEHLAVKGAAARVAVHEAEVRERAALLRRLRREQAYALHRCLGNLDWGFELAGQAPLARTRVRELVGAVYA